MTRSASDRANPGGEHADVGQRPQHVVQVGAGGRPDEVGPDPGAQVVEAGTGQTSRARRRFRALRERERPGHGLGRQHARGSGGRHRR